ncbi:MAG: glycosyltransferase family 2 protein [Candidatus Rokubacteria bacterium]|nr:glycosyltransferase family 2 protein [Candidatus Rokubacteria bacterium]
MISVVFSTRNGVRTLVRTCDALCRVDAPSGGWELIAVDNASTDDTAAVLARYRTRLPLTVLSCPTPGKNIALNLALAHVKGDLVVFTDDDVLPARDWLMAMKAVATEQASVAVFGGRILPEWPFPPPEWVLGHVDLAVAFGLHSDDMPEGLDVPWVVWGGNMMIRASVFRGGIRFNEALGPAPGQYVMGGETELVRRLSAAGHRCYFSNRPVVKHIIRPDQLTRCWTLHRARRHGKWLCVEESMVRPEQQRVALVFGVPRWRVRRLLTEYLRASAKGGWFATRASYRHSWNVQLELGFCAQSRAMSRATHPATTPGQAGS